MSALPPIADICSATRHIRFVPKADIAHSQNIQRQYGKSPAFQPGLRVIMSTSKEPRVRCRPSDVHDIRGRGCMGGSTPILTDRNLHGATHFFTCPHNFFPRACAILAIDGDGIDHPKKSKKKDEKKEKLAHIVSLSVRRV